MSKQLKATLAAISRHPGILRAHLIGSFLAGDFTDQEMRCLIDSLHAKLVRAFIVGAQTGNFNQAGTGNRQRVHTNHITYNITHTWLSK